MNNYLSIGFTLYHSFIHQHEVKVTGPNKGKRALLSKFIYTIIPKLTSEIVLNPFMIKYRKYYKKGVHTVRSVQPFYKNPTHTILQFHFTQLVRMFVSTDSGRACVYDVLHSHLFFLLFHLCGTFTVVVFFTAQGF